MNKPCLRFLQTSGGMYLIITQLRSTLGMKACCMIPITTVRLFFKDTKVFLLLEGGNIAGFIQLAVTCFVFTADGIRSEGYGLVRNLYFMPDCQNAHLLMKCADNYFQQHNIKKPHAFFHYFGMSCHAQARQAA